MADRPTRAAVWQARALTVAEHDQRVREAFDLEHQIKAGWGQVQADTWALAEHLYEFDQLRGWELVGHETIGEFLGQPELGIGTSTYYWMVRLWRDLVEVQKVSPARLSGLNLSKVREVTPAIMGGKVSVEQALNDAEALSRSDLRERYSQATIDAPLAAEKEPELVRCPVCSELTKTRFKAAAVGGDPSSVRNRVLNKAFGILSAEGYRWPELEALAKAWSTPEVIEGTARRRG